MKNKLTFEKISNYLPYGLKMNLNRNNGMFKSDNVSIDNCQINKNNSFYGWYLTYKNVTFGMYDIKPILRPLSDLTKEIEVNGEKFVPFDKINKLFPEYPLIKDSVCGINTFFISDSCELNMLSIYEVYKIYQKLFEWHFDLFSLIKNKLAIDINTL